jgi:hypothetical protein
MAQYLDHPRIAQQLLDQQKQINDLTAERDGAYRERDQLRATIERTVQQMQIYSAASSTGVNPRQVINLLSPTWPDGNFEAPGANTED